MTKKQSAGLLVYRRKKSRIEVLLVHPGGPFWVNKDEGAWSIPKGEFDEGEGALEAAKREFQEETGLSVDGEFHALAPVKQKSRKTVHAFAVEANIGVATIRSNTFEMEWPPKSCRLQEFPEADRAAWFSLDEARRKIHAGQAALLDQLTEFLPPRQQSRQN
jgi:predicted NUDIX family NTP pyrophosphohydrolase